MVLPIVKVPNAVLTTPVKQIQKIDTKVRRLVRDMENTLLAQMDPEGVGLAATQVGFSIALFISRPTPKAKVKVYINPKILKTEEHALVKKKRKSTTLEGCLSVDRVWSPIKRPQRILLSWTDINNQHQEAWFENFEAVIIQHEVDHLAGILFTARALEQKQEIYEEQDGELVEVDF